MKAWLRRKFIDYIVRDLFKAVDARDIFRVEGAGAFFNDKPIPPDLLERLITDAHRFENTLLWQVISRQLRYRASELIAYNSKTPSDMIAGKMLLYWVQVVEDILALIKKS